jgi:hypothetical protein
MIYNRKSYVIINGSLKMEIIKIQFQNDRYVKFKGKLTNRFYGYLYEIANYKLLKKDITHWIEEK